MDKLDFNTMIYTRVDFWNMTRKEKIEAEAKRLTKQLMWWYIRAYNQVPDMNIMRWFLEQSGGDFTNAVRMIVEYRTREFLGLK